MVGENSYYFHLVADERGTAMDAAREYRITGMVQGVGFRWRAKQIADAMGLSGWVRNNPDGSVTLVVAGGERGMNEYIERLEQALGRYIVEMKAGDSPSSAPVPGFEVVR